MSSAYRKLRPVLRQFVDAVIAGEKPTHVMRRLRPHIKRPHVLASKWKARPVVLAAIGERQAYATGLEERIARLEAQVAGLSAAVRCSPNRQQTEINGKGLEGFPPYPTADAQSIAANLTQEPFE